MVGLAEAAELLGLRRNTLCARTRRPDFPQPVAELAATPVWTRDQLVDYARQRCERYVERAAIQALAKDPDRIGRRRTDPAVAYLCEVEVFRPSVRGRLRRLPSDEFS